MRAAAGLHAHDALHRQGAGNRQEARILLGVDVVGDGADVVARAKGLAERFHQRRLAGADRPADADAKGSRMRSHERKSLVYWFSWWKEPRSARKVAAADIVEREPHPPARATSLHGRRASAAQTRIPAVCPIGARRIAAETSVLHETEQIGLERDRQRNAMRRGGHADRDRDRPRRLQRRNQARRRPGGKRRVEEAAPLLARFEVEFGGRRERKRQLVDFFEGGAVARLARLDRHGSAGWRRCARNPGSEDRAARRRASPRRSRRRPRPPIRAYANRHRSRRDRTGDSHAKSGRIAEALSCSSGFAEASSMAMPVMMRVPAVLVMMVGAANGAERPLDDLDRGT